LEEKVTHSHQYSQVRTHINHAIGIPHLAFPAMVARKLNCPARLTFSRTDDIATSFKRAETRVDWKVGLKDGKVYAAEVDVYYAAGAAPGFSPLIAGLVSLFGMTTYNIPNFTGRTHALKLNRAPTSAVRGAGVPQVKHLSSGLQTVHIWFSRVLQSWK